MDDNKRNQIYLAALLHDIGKFYERAYPEKYENDSVFKWSHAVYSRAFYDDYRQVKEVLEPFYKINERNKDFNLINLGAKHHNPENPDEKIIQFADWFSSSERLPKVDEDYQEGKSRQPLLSVFSNVFQRDTNKFLPLKKLSIEKIPDLTNAPSEVDKEKYIELWKLFLDDFYKLKGIKNIKVFAESFLKLLEKYTTTIPSSTRKNEIPDVSLFDHSKTTAAFSISIFNYIEETGSSIEGINNVDTKPFLLIGADLSGIQDFIYDIIGKKAAKNLKGRSFYLQILIESVVRHLLKEMNLFNANVIYSSGGNFYLIAQNTPKTIEKLKTFSNKVNDALEKIHHGKLFLAIAYSEFGKKELTEDDLGRLWENLISQKVAKVKKQRYLNQLNDDFFSPIILSDKVLRDKNGKFTKDKITGELIYKGEKTRDYEDGKIRYTTHKQIELGKLLRDANYWVISYEKHPNIKDEYIFNPFDERFFHEKEETGLNIYHYFLKEEPDYFYNSEIIQLNTTDFINSKFRDNIQSFEFYGGNDYPVYKEDDKKVDSGEVEIGEIKQFDDLAIGGSLSRLGILRMDVDNLGKIFALGFPEKMRTFSRLATLSRNMDWFFKGYLNTLWKDFKDNTMIIYSGGDDLFIVGRWDKTIEFAEKIKSEFARWTGNNPNLTISGGVAIVPGKFPILKGASMAGDFEEEAKSHKLKTGDCEKPEKNAFTLLGEPLNWNEEYKVVKEIKERIIKFSKEDEFPASFLRILIQFRKLRIQQRKEQKKFKEGKRKTNVNESWLWLSMYYLKRFSERNKKNKDLKNYAEAIQKDILANTYNSEFPPFLKQKDNHIINYYALAARWAELELRTNN